MKTVRIINLLMCILMMLATGCTATANRAATEMPICTVSPLGPLTTDINLYSPLMSSAFGIHIFAKDANGSLVKGKWTASWGQFCTATETQEGGWKISDFKAEWENASDIWWQFPLEQNPNGEMPSGISIWFEGGGARQTLTLEKAGDQLVKVAGTPDPTPVPIEVTLSAFPAVWCPGVSSASGVWLKATGPDGAPVKGDWSTPTGYFVIPPFRNADGSVSMPDQQPVREMKGRSEVQWLLGEEEMKQGAMIEARFTLGGRQTVMLLNWDADMGVVTIGERFAAFTEDEIRIVKEFKALVLAGKSADALLESAKANIGKLNNGFGEILADAIVSRLQIQSAPIDWGRVQDSLGGKEGDDAGRYIRIMRREAERPFATGGALNVPVEELADRYEDARSYVDAYPLRVDWHFGVEQLAGAYLGPLLTLNGGLFSGDGLSVPQDKRDSFNGAIQKHSGDKTGLLLESWVVLLKAEGWRLTGAVRAFLAEHGAQATCSSR